MPKNTSTKTSTDQDRDCAALARAALFPKRMHRDVADDSHFPALFQLDLLRDKLLKSWPNASVSSVFPRHVVVVRNLADGSIQWNGEPDFEHDAASFTVIPDQLTVTCTSQCDRLMASYASVGASQQQRAFRRARRGNGEGGQEIVLCSDRIMQSDSRDKRYQGVAKELPPKSLQAVEEVLAHQLVQVRHEHEDDSHCDRAQVELEAAKAAECYFSRHTYEERQQIKKGSRLQTGYSWLPSSLKSWSMNKCLAAVATEHLVARSVSQQEAEEAVKAALEKNQHQ